MVPQLHWASAKRLFGDSSAARCFGNFQNSDAFLSRDRKSSGTQMGADRGTFTLSETPKNSASVDVAASVLVGLANFRLLCLSTHP